MQKREMKSGVEQPLDSPDFDFKIVFDGGAIGNPGRGYGSYEVSADEAVVQHGREDYAGRITNNQAEYMTLIRSLRWLADFLGNDAAEKSVEIWGDSQLVINQLAGVWKVRNERLRPLVQEAHHELGRFGRTRLTWHPRAFSVARLGH
jgi:probable phosphoglycerate mutase